MIATELLDSAQPALSRRRVVDLRIGLTYTAVLLDDGSCGVAGTVRREAPSCCSVLCRAGDLKGVAAQELASGVTGQDPVATALGIATINATTNATIDTGADTGPGPLDVLPIDGARVGMVGYFEPFARELRARSTELHICEKRLSRGTGTLPDWVADQLLPRCDLVIITSLALVNGTLDHLLALCQGEVALVGPTTPMSQVLFEHGVDHLFGSVVLDGPAILDVVSQAGGTHRFKKATRKVYLANPHKPPGKGSTVLSC